MNSGLASGSDTYVILQAADGPCPPGDTGRSIFGSWEDPLVDYAIGWTSWTRHADGSEAVAVSAVTARSIQW